jgi:hypothetical protein
MEEQMAIQSRQEQGVSSLRHGQHVTLLYEQAGDQMGIAALFLQEGLARNERCLYIADEHNLSETVSYLAQKGIDVEHLVSQGSMRLLTDHDTPDLHGPSFKPDVMIKHLDHAMEEATARGFTGLRIVGEMTWALGVGRKRLVEFEALFNDFHANVRAVSLCQYQVSQFAPELLTDILRTHPLAILGDEMCPNFYYEPPSLVLGRDSEAVRMKWMMANLRLHANERSTVAKN